MKPWPPFQPELRVDELVLRPWRADDIDDVFVACQDPNIQRWTTVPSPYVRDDAVAFTTEIAPALWRDREGAAFAVVDASSAQVLASISLQRVHVEAPDSVVGEIGYWVSALHRGRAVASRSARAVATWALESLGLDRIEILVEPDNHPSRSAALAAGGVEAELAHGRCEARDGSRRDVLVYVISRPDDPRN